MNKDPKELKTCFFDAFHMDGAAESISLGVDPEIIEVPLKEFIEFLP